MELTFHSFKQEKVHECPDDNICTLAPIDWDISVCGDEKLL